MQPNLKKLTKEIDRTDNFNLTFYSYPYLFIIFFVVY